MSQPTQSGVLTLSGALYEGADFEAWRHRMEALLTLHGLDYYNSHVDLHWSVSHNVKSHERALQILVDHISPTIFSRLSEDVRSDIKQLWLKLPVAARPFRFMDLHSELRNSIYRLHLRCDQVRDIEKERIPALLQVSKNVREETRSIYYAEKCFGITLCHGVYDGYSYSSGRPVYIGTHRQNTLVDSVSKWAEREVVHDMKHLRSFDVTLRKRKTIRLIISASGELKASGAEKDMFVQRYLQEFHEYVARVERQRKILRLKGEGIILALTSEPNIFT